MTKRDDVILLPQIGLFLIYDFHIINLHVKNTLQPLKPDDHVIIQASGHFLQIKEGQVSDTGRYTCLASNIAGEDEVEFDVNIQGKQNSNNKIPIFLVV